MNQLFCKDCKYFRECINSPLCVNPAALKEYDIVYGFPLYKDAREMRKPGAQCGFTARLFEHV